MVLDPNVTLGLRIKSVRQARGFTQENLAEAVGRTVETISNIERGRTAPPLATLRAIALHLGLPMTDLLDEAAPSRDRREAELRARLIELARRLRHTDLEVALKQLQALHDRGG